MTPTIAAGHAARPLTGRRWRGRAVKLSREAVAPQRRLLITAGGLLVGGELLALVAGMFHPSTAHPNRHVETFREYAASNDWLAVHIGQFVGTMLVISGLIVLYRALARTEVVGTLALVAVCGTVASGALAALVNAVDGVMLKQTVDAWASATGPSKVLAFHDAESARWLEWGANSFMSLLEGATIVLFGFAIARTAIVPRWIGWAAVIAGLDYLIVGAVIGHDGFSDAVAGIGAPGGLLLLVVAFGIAISGWRATGRDREDASPAAVGSP